MSAHPTLKALLVLSLLMAWPLPAQQQARVETFSPQGTVKKVRQVRVRFSEPMVPFGDPRTVVTPFEIDCPREGSSRWADPKNWVFDFAEDLPAGVRCEFRVQAGLKTLSGNEIGGQRRFGFSTGGPAIISCRPWEGAESIDEEQVFILELDGDATEESILRNVYFVIEGMAGRVGARIVTGSERESLIGAEFGYNQERRQQYLRETDRHPLIQSKQRFPNGAKIKLVWGRGVASPSGVASEQDQVLPFATRTPFMAAFHCMRENPDAECVPISPMRVSFSAPVEWGKVAKTVLKGPDNRQWTPENPFKSDEEEDHYVNNVTFKGPFPEKAAFSIELPPGIRDDSGRSLMNADRFPLSVRTDAYPPLAKFAADFGILELKANPLLPVTLRNVEPAVSARMFEVEGGDENIDPVSEEPDRGDAAVAGNMRGRVLQVSSEKTSQILSWIRKVGERSWEDRGQSVFGAVTAEKATKFSIPKLEGAKAFEVVGIPLKKPGFYVVEIESEILGAALLGEPKPMYVPATVLVTNLSVQFKWGLDASLVWVTTLDAAKPVPRAEVKIRDCGGQILWEGLTDRNGLARVPGLPNQSNCTYERFGSGLLATAQLGDDMAFVHTSWNDGIEPWRFRIPTDWERRLSIAHTIFDRSLLRAGETVHMKHIARKHGSSGFLPLEPAELGNSLMIRHLGSDQTYELPLSWDSGGIAETTWEIPREAKLGEYQVQLAKQGAENYHPSSGSFRVEEYRVPLMRGVIRPPTEPQVAPSSIPLDLTVGYLAGGGAGSLPVKLRYDVRRGSVTPFERFKDFIFTTGKVREGLIRRDVEQDGQEEFRLQSMDLTLDKTGSARAVLPELPRADRPLEILAELEFADPNGEVQTVSSRIPLWPADRHIGIKPDSWALSKESLKFQVAVADLNGRPVAGAPVKVDLLQQKTFSHRKRLIGGYYAYEHSTENRRIQTLCEGKTDGKGLLWCEKPSPISGNIILEAVTQDSKGREVATSRSVWVGGADEWWFRAEDSDRMDLIPEAGRYEPGAKAKLQVRMPFRKATALITIEREGVADAVIRELSGKEPVIEVPVKGSYAPNVFVSVLVMRGRMGDVQPTATVDLGRPAFKLGIAELRVGWKAHELQVKVASDRPVYKVRDKARVSIEVRTAGGKRPPPGAEVALAAVDEGLLELMPNTSWDLLEAMMEQRRYGVQTSIAQMYVIGKRHFGLKALPQGGGGGRQITRELFDTLLLWKGRVPLDEKGNAAVEVPLNDSLTSFRIVAVANAGVDLFGTGSTSIRSTQDLMILPGVAPLVRQGDKYRSQFTLRNTTSSPMNVNVALRIDGSGEPLEPISVSLEAAESREIGWNITAPADADSLRYELVASGGEGISDHLSVSQKVVPVVPVRTYQATMTQVDGSFRVEVERPPDAVPGQGGVEVELRPTLLSGLTGVFEYMGGYPYDCLEQKTSKAVALRDAALWGRIMAQLPSYLDADGLVKYFPSMRLGSDSLTAYLLAIAHEAGWQIPDDSRNRMINGLRGFVEGKTLRHSALPTADLSIRKLAAVEALSRHMGGNIPQARRAGAGPPVIDARLLSSISIEPNLWPTSAVIDWANILARMTAIPNREKRIAEAEQVLRARLNFQGTSMGFSTEGADFLWWLMVSPDVNPVRLLLSRMVSAGWREDIPRMVRGALGRQRRGHWDTTVANAWGVLAMEKFSKLFENIPVTGSSTASLSGAQRALDWSAAPKGDVLTFNWPDSKSPLDVQMAGTGKPWATFRSLAAIPLRKPLATGFSIKRTLIPIERKEASAWNRGDILRVRLEIDSQADMTWVVVSDPIPAGAAIIGTGLARDSQLLAKGEKRQGLVWPAYEERSFEAFRSYYEYVPKGSWTVEYTLRLNNRGTMNLPTTRVEALYAPEMFGEIPNEAMTIR